MNQNLKRESVYRHRSERLIDRFLIRAEKKQVEDLQLKLKELEKRREIAQKRQKVDPKLVQEELKKKEEEKQKEDLRKKYSQVDHYQALCKIIKHLYSPKKFSKCLKMLDNLIREYFDFFDGNTLFNTLDAIMKYDKKFEMKEDREVIEALYLFLIELSDNEEGIFSEEQEKIIDLYYIPVYVQSHLYTDDSFKFNEVVKEVTEMLDSLESMYSLKQDQYQELCQSQQKIQECFQEKGQNQSEAVQENKQTEEEEFLLPQSKCIYEEVFEQEEEDFIHFLNGMKRRLFFETLKNIFQFHKHAWAKQTVIQTLKKVYLEKQRLNEDEQELLEDMISQLQSKTSIGMKNVQNRDRMDQKIKSNPLESMNPVRDARTERVVFESGQDKWSSKQTGLTWADQR